MLVLYHFYPEICNTWFVKINKGNLKEKKASEDKYLGPLLSGGWEDTLKADEPA